MGEFNVCIYYGIFYKEGEYQPKYILKNFEQFHPERFEQFSLEGIEEFLPEGFEVSRPTEKEWYDNIMYEGHAVEQIDDEWANKGDPIFIGRRDDGNHLDYYLGIRATLHI